VKSLISDQKYAFAIQEDRLEPDADFKPNLVNTVCFLVNWIIQITTFAVNYVGDPFMTPLKDNRGLAGCTRFAPPSLSLISSTETPFAGEVLVGAMIDASASRNIAGVRSASHIVSCCGAALSTCRPAAVLFPCSLTALNLELDLAGAQVGLDSAGRPDCGLPAGLLCLVQPRAAAEAAGGGRVLRRHFGRRPLLRLGDLPAQTGARPDGSFHVLCPPTFMLSCMHLRAVPIRRLSTQLTVCTAARSNHALHTCSAGSLDGQPISESETVSPAVPGAAAAIQGLHALPLAGGAETRGGRVGVTGTRAACAAQGRVMQLPRPTVHFRFYAHAPEVISWRAC